MGGRGQRSVVVAVVLTGLLAVGAPGVAGGSGLEARPVPTSPSTLPEPDGGVPGNIIPEPNSGVAPDDPGDRGGWEQLAVLAAIVAGVGIIGLLVVRESRRRRPVAD